MRLHQHCHRNRFRSCSHGKAFKKAIEAGREAREIGLRRKMNGAVTPVADRISVLTDSISKRLA